MKRLTLYLLIMVLLGAPAFASGQEEDMAVSGGTGSEAAQPQDTAAGQEVAAEQETVDEEEGAEETPAVHYELPTEASAWLGGRFVHIDGSRRAMEYGWPYSSVAGGFKLHYSLLPHRIDAEFNWLDLYEYDADFSYAYKDILKLSYAGLGLWHNLDHFVPQPVSDLNDEDPDATYQVHTNDDRIFVRLKWPERAYHAFSDFRQFEKQGTIQERFYTGEKNSISRDIDWITRRYNSGLNGHFGPIELEYSHLTKTFEPHDDVSSTVSIFGSDTQRSVIPEFETNSDTVKAHSDLTGRIVASATFTAGEKQNHNSGAEVDFTRANTDLTLIPFDHVTVAVRYRFNGYQEAVPSQVDDVTNFGLTSTKEPMDSRTHTAGVTMRYVPMNQLGINAEYQFKNVERSNTELWSDSDITPFQGVPSDQNVHKVKLGFNARPLKVLSFKGSAVYEYTDDPSYATMLKNSFKGSLDADWEATRDINAAAYYRLERGDNSNAQMHLWKDNIGTLVTWLPVERVSVYANYDYSRYRNKREIDLLAGSFGSDTEAYFPSELDPYNDRSHLYSIGANYVFSFPLTLGVDFHQSWSRGTFTTTDGTVVDGITTDGLGDATDLRIRETGGGMNARYDFPKGWGATFTYNISNYEDLEDNPQDGSLDGTAHTVMVMLSKKW